METSIVSDYRAKGKSSLLLGKYQGHRPACRSDACILLASRVGMAASSGYARSGLPRESMGTPVPGREGLSRPLRLRGSDRNVPDPAFLCVFVVKAPKTQDAKMNLV